MKKYLIEKAMVYYIDNATNDFNQKFGKADAVVRSRQLINYTFTDSDILPHEGLTYTDPNGRISQVDIAKDCYTVYDMSFPKGWFWVRSDGVREI